MTTKVPHSMLADGGGAPVSLTGSNTLTEALHANRHLNWTGASAPSAQTLPSTQALGDFIEITNNGSVPITISNCNSAPGFKKSAQPGETFQAVSNGASYDSITPRVNNVIQALSDGATIVWDTDISGTASVTLGGNRTLSITNHQDGGVYQLWVTQDGTGSRILTQPAAAKKAAADSLTLSTGINKVDLLVYTYNATKAIFETAAKLDIG